jgi:DNA-binding transcriptional regulator WhiA
LLQTGEGNPIVSPRKVARKIISKSAIEIFLAEDLAAAVENSKLVFKKRMYDDKKIVDSQDATDDEEWVDAMIKDVKLLSGSILGSVTYYLEYVINTKEDRLQCKKHMNDILKDVKQKKFKKEALVALWSCEYSPFLWEIGDDRERHKVRFDEDCKIN